MTVQAAKQTVANNPCAATAATVGTGMALLTWAAGEAGVSVPSWVAALAAGAAVFIALTVSTDGLVGIWRRLLYGTGTPDA